MQVPIYAAYLYDAVSIYARALKEALDDGTDPKNGTVIVDRLKGRMYDSKPRLLVFSFSPMYSSLRSKRNRIPVTILRFKYLQEIRSTSIRIIDIHNFTKLYSTSTCGGSEKNRLHGRMAL